MQRCLLCATCEQMDRVLHQGMSARRSRRRSRSFGIGCTRVPSAPRSSQPVVEGDARTPAADKGRMGPCSLTAATIVQPLTKAREPC